MQGKQTFERGCVVRRVLYSSFCPRWKKAKYPKLDVLRAKCDVKYVGTVDAMYDSRREKRPFFVGGGGRERRVTWRVFLPKEREKKQINCTRSLVCDLNPLYVQCCYCLMTLYSYFNWAESLWEDGVVKLRTTVTFVKIDVEIPKSLGKRRKVGSNQAVIIDRINR